MSLPHLSFNFGFKAKHSKSQCKIILKETLTYYVTNQSRFFGIFLDASKMFDQIQNGKPFRLLIKWNLPAIIIRVLLNLYMGNLVSIDWNCVFSHYFMATNGVKQDCSVLNSVLFCVFTDVTLPALTAARAEWYLGSAFLGSSRLLHMLTISFLLLHLWPWRASC